MLMDYCLSVFPHWAWAIVHGAKRVENRTWPTRHRGRLFIHASSRLRPIAQDQIALLHGMPPRKSLTTGAVVGFVTVLDCVPVREKTGDPYACGPWCWVLGDPTPIPPVACLGRCGLWAPPQRAVALAQRIHTRRSRD